MSAGATLISFDKVWKTYGHGEAKVHALAGVDLAIRRGSFPRQHGPVRFRAQLTSA